MKKFSREFQSKIRNTEYYCYSCKYKGTKVRIVNRRYPKTTYLRCVKCKSTSLVPVHKE